MDDSVKYLSELAQRFAELTNQALLAFAKSGNAETTILPQIMVSDFLPRNYLKAEIYIKSVVQWATWY